MKKLWGLLLPLVLCSACTLTGITGNGKIAEENRSVQDFQRLRASGSFEIILQQGHESSLRLEADENLLPLIETYVNQGTLNLSTAQPILRAERLRVYLQATEWQKIELSGATEISSDGPLKGESLDLEASGAAEIEMEVYVKKLRAQLSGASEVDLKGKAETVSLQSSGAADWNAFDLETKRMSINCSGASELEVNVSEDLAIEASGASEIQYRGSPIISKSKMSGASTINGN